MTNEFGSYKIDHRYTVVKELGGGLSGEVMLVSDKDGEKALKFLKKIQLNVSREEALKNFKNEFEILKKLNHPHIARILDFGCDEKLQKYYFTSEFVSGALLDKACEKQPIDVTEKLIVQVLRALNYLHSRGVYHFDIKPQNILVHLKDGLPDVAKIIDFGLAGYSSPRKRVGTPAYMAPEVVQGGLLDGRTDLYSLGIVIYKIFTSINPFAAKSLKETLDRHVGFTQPTMRSLKPDVPEYWDHIVKRMLEKNPSERYSQASLIIRDLGFLSNKPIEIETRDTKLSYLPDKGVLIGREAQWKLFTDLFAQSFLEEKPLERKIFILEGGRGTGKSRLMSEIKYYSQIRSVPVRSLTQVNSPEGLPQQFILIIEENELTADGVNAFLQEFKHERCLVVWAAEVAPHGWTNAVVATLGSYTSGELKKYLESVTGLENVPAKLLDEVYGRTQGNPLLVTEFVKALFDQDLLYDAAGKWDATTFEDIPIDFDKLHIPNTVEEYILSKFRALPKHESEVAAWLSVHRDDLELEHLEKLMVGDGCSRDELHDVLLSLTEKGIVRKTSREFTYYFQNPLFGDVICKSLDPENVKGRHGRLAEIFEGDKSRLRAQLYHLGHSSDQKRAVEATNRLAEIYVEEQAHNKVAETLEWLLTIIDGADLALRKSIDFRLAEAYKESQQTLKAVAILTTLKEGLVRTAPGWKTDFLRVQGKLVLLYFRINQNDKAEAAIREALDLLEHEWDSPEALEFRNDLGYLRMRQSDLAGAESVFIETQKVWFEKLSDDGRALVVNNRLSELYLLQKKFHKAIEVCKQSITVLKKGTPTIRLAILYYVLGDAYYQATAEGVDGNRTDYTQLCFECMRESEAIARKFNYHRVMLTAFNGIGNIHFEKGEIEQALQYYQRALTVARKVNDLLVAATIACNISNCYKKLGNDGDAYSHAIYALNTLEALPSKTTHAWMYIVQCHLALAEIHFLRKHYSEAHSVLDRTNPVMEGRAFLDTYLCKKHFIRLKLYHAEGKQKEFREELTIVRTRAIAVNDKDELENFLQVIGYEEGPISEPARQPIPQAEPQAVSKAVPELVQQPEQQAVSQEVSVMYPPLKMQSHAQGMSLPVHKGGPVMLKEQKSQDREGDDLHRIIEINNFINSEHDLAQLLKIVLNYALQLSKAETGFVILLEDDGSFVPATSLNATPEDEEKVSLSIVKMAIESGEIVTSPDAVSDERFDASESVVMNELKSILCLPIKSKNRSVGVFYLDNRYRVNVFEKCNVTLLKAFCDQVGIALENAKLIGQLKEAHKRVEDKLQQTEEELAEVKTLLIEESGVFKAKYSYSNIISKSKEMQNVFKLLDKVTETNLSVFLHGESGTGKELVAKALHYNNPQRGTKRFVAINCGAIPSTLMESELFGHKMGSFTGAIRDKKGMFEEANGGTLFLDEIGELPMELQVKLLRVLQESEVQRIGDNHVIKVDVRMVSASLKDIETMVKEGKFREDLYYRLCQMRINLPPLRNRPDDISGLAKHFVKKYCQQNKMDETLQIPPEFMKALLEYQWPGNIRELENMMYVACALQDKGEIRLDALPDHYGIKKLATGTRPPAAGAVLTAVASNPADQSVSLSSTERIDTNNFYNPHKTWREYESIIIAKCYLANGKKKKIVADQLDLSHSTVYKKIEELNLDDTSNPLFAADFIYDNKHTMKEYVQLIFQVALKHHDNHPYAAIKQLGVSQGYFYKIIKQGKETVESLVVET